MSSDVVIRLDGAGKCYPVGGRPLRRMWNLLIGQRAAADGFWALRSVDLEVRRGEAVGIVGHNGAGKSTLLQMVAGTLAASAGEITVLGRIAALLELGAGFNPEFTGRENVYLTAAMSGLTRAEIAERFDAIVSFSGIDEFLDRPVKTYSSGMLVRLAFSIAVHVDPDILIIDEALSVGDGEFARRSFDRIMHFRESGKTLLFCSHSLYQIEALCDRAVWLDHGRKRMEGAPADVTVAYDADLNAKARAQSEVRAPQQPVSAAVDANVDSAPAQPATSTGRLVAVRLNAQEYLSGSDDLAIDVEFESTPALPVPSVALCVVTADGRMVTSTSTLADRVSVVRDARGRAAVRLVIPRLPLLKGNYSIDAYLMCERGIHVYDSALGAARFSVRQNGLELGLVLLPRRWEVR